MLTAFLWLRSFVNDNSVFAHKFTFLPLCYTRLEVSLSFMSLPESLYSLYLFIWEIFIEPPVLLSTVSGVGTSSDHNKVFAVLELTVVT